jgi:hypothetical protein
VHPVSACLQLNGHHSCGYNDIIPETKNEYDIETMVGSWFMMFNATFNNISESNIRFPIRAIGVD